MTISVSDTQHINALHHAKCRVLFIIVLNVITLSFLMLAVIWPSFLMLNVIKLSVVMLNVVAPIQVDVETKEALSLQTFLHFSQEMEF